MKPTLALASIVVLLLAAGVARARPQTLMPNAAAACSPQGKSATVDGKAATIYCGPARVTVRFGGKTASFKNGTCVWGASSFKLQMGTIYLFRPRIPRQIGFSIYASGYPTARALIEFSWAGKFYFGTTLHMSAKPSANRTGGTFRGRLGRSGSGPLATGVIRCS